MTNTDPTPPASKPSGRKKQNTATTEQFPEAPASTTVAAPAAAQAPAPVTQTRTGIGAGILIGAIAAALVGGIALGGGAGALIATVASHHDRPGFSQAGPQGQPGQGGPQFGQQDGQQGWQQGPGQQDGQVGPQGGMPPMPPQQTVPGQTEQDGTDSGDGSN